MDKGNDNLIITLPSSNGDGVLANLTNKAPGVDLLFLTCGDQAWMSQGVPRVTHSLFQTVELVKEQMRDYKKVCVMGSSCGGYLAVVLGILARPHSIVAFDPYLEPLPGAQMWLDPDQWLNAPDLAKSVADTPNPPTWIYHGSGSVDVNKAVALENTGYKLTRQLVPGAHKHGEAMRVLYAEEAPGFKEVCAKAFA